MAKVKDVKRLLKIIAWLSGYALDHGEVLNAALKDGIQGTELRKVHGWAQETRGKINKKVSSFRSSAKLGADFSQAEMPTVDIFIDAGELPDPRGPDGVVASSGEPEGHIFFEEPEGRLNG